MRALVLNDTELTLDPRREAPTPKVGEALIRPIRLGISGLDGAVVAGLGGFRGIPGHEFVGIVEEVNSETSAKLRGKRVVGAIATACGRCDLCTGGLGAHCRERALLGIEKRDGCFAERFTLPARNLVAVPDGLDDDHALFAHALASAIQAARQLTIEGKPYITVLGDGPLGLLTAQVMVRLNASVRLVGRHPEKFGLCEKWGVKHRHVDDVGRRADQDVVVDCTGTMAGFGTAMRLVRPRGIIVRKSLIAPAASSTAIDFSPVVQHELQVIGSFLGPVGEAVSMLARGEIDVVSMISRRCSLDDGVQAFRIAARPETVKVLMDVS